MGHCFSCFHSISGPPTTSPSDQSNSTKDETSGNEERAAVKVNSDCVNEATLQPLLCNENQRNGNKRNNSSSVKNISGSGANMNNANKSENCTSATHLGESNKKCASASLNRSNEKVQGSFYNKIGMPKSVCSGESRLSDSRLISLFLQYKHPNEDAILSDGIEKLCNDLQLCPDEFQVLVLAWKLNAEQMCCFTKTEFVEGLKNMKVDSIKGLQSRLPEIVADLVKDNDLFKDLYRFTFKFGLDVVAGQRILPIDVAIVLWRLVFTICEPPILTKWLQYLENHPHIRGIPKDTWYMFLNFCDTVGVDLSSYDDTEAWPSLFDDFVEYQNDQMNQNISKNETLKLSD